MKFLCLMYCEGRVFDEMSPADMTVFQEDCRTHDSDLKASGHYVAAEALESVKTATTIRVRRGTAVLTDGPFAETKEQLCGFVVIDVKDIDEALAIAKTEPFAKVGAVELRPIMNF